jgi:hypothetical protein
VYLLSETLKLIDNIDEGLLQKSDDTALGLALISKSALENIKGYDEFYCFWGYEDNDIKLRLERAGFETIFYNEDMLMFHQWHSSSKNNHAHLPEFWGIFQRDYFNDNKKEYLKINSGGWGKLYHMHDRPALRININSSVIYINISHRLDYSIYIIFNQLLECNHGNIICFEFQDRFSFTHIKSTTGKITKVIDRVFRRFNVSLKIISYYQGNYTTLYEFRDRLIYNIMLFKSIIKDYVIEETHNSIKVILIKN